MTRGVSGQSPANVQNYLEGAHYPSRKQDLIITARKNGAPGEIIEVLEKLPGEEFGGPQDVMRAYGQESKGESS